MRSQKGKLKILDKAPQSPSALGQGVARKTPKGDLEDDDFSKMCGDTHEVTNPGPRRYAGVCRVKDKGRCIKPGIKGCCIFFLCLLVTVQSCDVPVWNKGDTWVWSVTDLGVGRLQEVFESGKTETNLLKSVVVGKEVMEGVECYHDYETYDGHPEYEYHSYYSVSCPPTEHHGIQYSTATGKPVLKSTIYPGNYIVQFPLYQGKTWKQSYTAVEWTYHEENDSWVQTSEISVEVESEVKGIESVTVPAGTFEAYRIEGMYYTFKMVRSVVWYSPEVKNSVKGEAYVIEDKIPTLYYTYELVEYHLATPLWLKIGCGILIIAAVPAVIMYVRMRKAKKDGMTL